MPDIGLGPKYLNVQVTVYDGDRPMTTALCTLWLDSDPVEGAIAVPSGQDWVSFDHLTLITANGTEYRIVPRRLEHIGGAGPMLLFDIG